METYVLRSLFQLTFRVVNFAVATLGPLHLNNACYYFLPTCNQVGSVLANFALDNTKHSQLYVISLTHDRNSSLFYQSRLLSEIGVCLTTLVSVYLIL